MVKAKNCKDKNCPICGTISTRGRQFKGTVISDKASRTVSVEWEWQNFVPKYERFEKKRTKVKAHNSSCIGAKLGDLVIIKESKPISKTKKFVVTQIIK